MSISNLKKLAAAVKTERDRAIEKYGECGGQTSDTGRYLKLQQAIDAEPDEHWVCVFCGEARGESGVNFRDSCTNSRPAHCWKTAHEAELDALRAERDSYRDQLNIWKKERSVAEGERDAMQAERDSFKAEVERIQGEVVLGKRDYTRRLLSGLAEWLRARGAK